VFRLMGFAPHENTEEGRTKFLSRMAVSAAVLIILAVPLVQTLRRAVTQIGLGAGVREVVDRGFKTKHSTIADLSYTQVGGTFQVSVTVRTTQYFGTEQIEVAQDALRKRFGPNAQLLVDQILVAQGGLSPEQISRRKDFISGEVLRPAPKQVLFDLKAAQESLTSYLAKQVDEALQGTSIRRTGAVQVVLGGAGPVGLHLRLATPMPLEDQTVALLAAQLSAKISTPTELHATVELESPDYALDLQSPNLRGGLAREAQSKLRDLAAMVFKGHNLELRATVSAGGVEPAALKESSVWREVEVILSRSGLKTPQWSLQAAPTPGPPGVEGAAPASATTAPGVKATGTPPSPGPVQYNFRVF